LGLTIGEAKVCGALCRLGETDAKTVSDVAKIPYSRAESLLLGLQERGMVTSYGNLPRVFSLARA
jgi:sugar-specific transcriptional regulator TrmB